MFCFKISEEKISKDNYGKYAIPQTSTFKELLEILDFEENKNVNDPIP